MIDPRYSEDSTKKELLQGIERMTDERDAFEAELGAEIETLTDQLEDAASLLRRCLEYVPEDLRAEIQSWDLPDGFEFPDGD